MGEKNPADHGVEYNIGKLEKEDNGYFLSGQFDYFVSITESGNKLEQIEKQVEQAVQAAKLPKRIDDLIGYLLRKKRWIVNYADRNSKGLWIASTRVEKWNDLAVGTIASITA